ncbi:MAG: hypothetical protein V3V99_01470 [candidate division Zixibacteria bacterium]
MNYFEINKRLAAIKKFRKLYLDYISFTNRFENPAAQMLLKKMRPLVPMTIDSMREAKVGTIVTHDAPARGSKRYKINIIKAIFRESLVRNFNLEDDAPMQALEATVVKYETMKSRAFFQLFNPFFWFIEFVGYAADGPYTLIDKAGIDTTEFRKTAGAKTIKLFLMAVIILLTVELTGLREWLWAAFN